MKRKVKLDRAGQIARRLVSTQHGPSLSQVFVAGRLVTVFSAGIYAINHARAWRKDLALALRKAGVR